jgi:hypothetical protein
MLNLFPCNHGDFINSVLFQDLVHVASCFFGRFLFLYLKMRLRFHFFDMPDFFYLRACEVYFFALGDSDSVDILDYLR